MIFLMWVYRLFIRALCRCLMTSIFYWDREYTWITSKNKTYRVLLPCNFGVFHQDNYRRPVPSVEILSRELFIEDHLLIAPFEPFLLGIHLNHLHLLLMPVLLSLAFVVLFDLPSVVLGLCEVIIRIRRRCNQIYFLPNLSTS